MAETTTNTTQSVEDLKNAQKTKTTELSKALQESIAGIDILTTIPDNPNSREYVDWYYTNRDAIARMKENIGKMTERWNKFNTAVQSSPHPEFAQDPQFLAISEKIALVNTILTSSVPMPGNVTRQGFEEKRMNFKDKLFSTDIDVISTTNLGSMKNLGLLGEDASSPTNGYWLMQLGETKYILKTRLDPSNTNAPVYMVAVSDDISKLDLVQLKAKLVGQLDSQEYKKAELNNSSFWNTFELKDLKDSLTDLPLGTMTAAAIAEAIVLKLSAIATRSKIGSWDPIKGKQAIVDALGKVPLLGKAKWLDKSNVTKAVLVAAIVTAVTTVLFTDRDLVRSDLDRFMASNTGNDRITTTPADTTSQQSTNNIKDLLGKLKK